MYVLKDQFQTLRALQEMARRGPAVKVAVLDGNFDAENPSLSSQKIASTSTSGKTLHGTAVASIILGRDTGIAPQAEGLQFPVFEEDANGHLRGCSQLTLARAIRAACEAGASIINISGANLTNTGHPTDELREAVEHCENNNIAVVAAVGNDALSVDTVPANLHGVIAVGAHDIEGHPACFNNTGPGLMSKMILAPGVDIRVHANGGEARISGSSFAAPMVSGVCALIRQILPDFPIRDLHELLSRSCVPCDLSHSGDHKPTAVRRLDLVLLHQNLRPHLAPQVAPQNFISERTNLMSEIDTSPAAVEATIEPASLPQPVGSSTDIVPMEAGHEPQAVAEFNPVPAAPRSHADIRDSAPSNFLHTQPDTIRPQHTGSNLMGDNKVFAIGTLGYDFTNETNRDYFQQAMYSLGERHPHLKPLIPENEIAMARFLTFVEDGETPYLDSATALEWTLKVDGIPIYVIRPQNQFAVQQFGRMIEFLIQQTGIDVKELTKPKAQTADLISKCAAGAESEDKIDRVSIAGNIVGETRLYNGQIVPVVSPILRGMFSWNPHALAKAVLKADAKKEEVDRLKNFLERIYYELRNRGAEPQHRAMNFAATNAHVAGEIFTDAFEKKLELNTINVQRSPVSRPGTDCWDIVCEFFNPFKRDQEARMIYRYTIDVTGMMPVTFGPLRSWRAF
ncbi:S8 family serine peptidase [Roseibium sediminis]|uniref:cyanobactin maturation protease PatG family protein n=1 Tax=Roseibium sediminis TaxID=1775174 RepID=UPI00123C9F9D|nr:S8 family serine peptidase [Roseibium sediminis]